MDSLFILQLALSFAVGGSFIALNIWIAERFGSKIGGLLAGLPTTLLVGLAFIAISQDSQAAIHAVSVVPAALGAGVLFLAIFAATKHKRLPVAFILGTICWLVLALPLVLFDVRSLSFSLVIGAVFFSIAIWYLHRFPHQKIKSFHLTKKELLLRIILSGGMVALAVFLGKTLGELWGGLFASFPIAFATSMYILSTRYGTHFAASVARTMPYGSIGNVVFALGFYFIAPILGIVWGFILGYIISWIFALVIYKTVLSK